MRLVVDIFLLGRRFYQETVERQLRADQIDQFTAWCTTSGREDDGIIGCSCLVVWMTRSGHDRINYTRLALARIWHMTSVDPPACASSSRIFSAQDPDAGTTMPFYDIHIVADAV
jgi:hypothetical protein